MRGAPEKTEGCFVGSVVQERSLEQSAGHELTLGFLIHAELGGTGPGGPFLMKIEGPVRVAAMPVDFISSVFSPSLSREVMSMR